MRMIGWGALAVVCSVGCAETAPATRQSSSASAGETSSSDDNAAAHDPDRHHAIERTFARKTGDLQNCWAEEYDRTKDRKLQGEVTVQLMVTPSGKPSDVKILKTSLNNPAIESCVVKTVTGWSFPEGNNTMPYHRAVHLGAQF
jgi:TonB family protein